MENLPNLDVAERTRDYYDSECADAFYLNLWGGDDIHIGIYEEEDEDIREASRRTVAGLADLLEPITPDSLVLDIGSGYGGSSRYLAERFGCRVECVNLSRVQNRRNRGRNEAEGWGEVITVIDGSFEDLPQEDESAEVVWSQDALLHSGNREKVLAEVDRVLKPGGRFAFTDIMMRHDCPRDSLGAVLDRIHLSSLGSPEFYRDTGAALDWELVREADLSNHLARHYQRVFDEMERRSREVARFCSDGYVERMKEGLRHWILHGEDGNLRWGMFLFRKPG